MFKKLLLITALLSTGAMANTEEQNKELEMCKAFERLAGSVMEARQSNTSMSVLVDAVKGDKISLAMIQDAYRQPVYRVQANKESAVNEFKNTVFKTCYTHRVAKEL